MNLELDVTIGVHTKKSEGGVKDFPDRGSKNTSAGGGGWGGCPPKNFRGLPNTLFFIRVGPKFPVLIIP